MTPSTNDLQTKPPAAQSKSKALATLENVCAFWIGRRCFALDIRIVAEVVTIDSIIPVPLSRPELLGLFNLRGTPAALVDLERVLELPASERAEAPNAAGRSLCAFVLRPPPMTASLLIERREIVLPVSAELLT